MSEFFERLSLPCVLTDGASRCVDANAAFRSELPKLQLRLVRGRLSFGEARMQARWESALSETLVTAVGRIVSAGTKWSVHLVPWRDVAVRSNDFDRRLVLAIFAQRAEDTLASVSTYQPLTTAEQEVLAALMRGLPAKAIAQQRQSSPNTIRRQIMAILRKTGHHSQRELIASFGSSFFDTEESNFER
jgi:DNA-binding CsgD family transcriptional regulator